MARNPSPNLILNLTLTLTLFLLHLPSLAFSLSPSPSPSPSPSRNLKPQSSTANPVNQPLPSHGTSVDRHQPPWKTIVNHPPAARIQPDMERNNRKLNFGEKIGILFAIVAGAMQFVFVGFLAIKRWQLGRTDRGYRERDQLI